MDKKVKFVETFQLYKIDAKTTLNSTGKDVSFGVEDVVVQQLVDNGSVVAEQKIEVFERLAQPKRLLHILRSCIVSASDVRDGRVATRGHLGVLLECKENLGQKHQISLKASKSVFMKFFDFLKKFALLKFSKAF